MMICRIYVKPAHRSHKALIAQASHKEVVYKMTRQLCVVEGVSKKKSNKKKERNNYISATRKYTCARRLTKSCYFYPRHIYKHIQALQKFHSSPRQYRKKGIYDKWFLFRKYFCKCARAAGTTQRRNRSHSV